MRADPKCSVTVEEWLRDAEVRLAASRVVDVRIEAQLLLSHALGVDRSWVLAHGSDPFDPEHATGLLSRREVREPLAYILGWREFYGRRFAVDRRVLIPRQETEALVELALEELAKDPNARALDLGTGSGCIAITLKLERPELEVWGSDASAGALEVARANGEALGADVRWVESDGFAGIRGTKFDAVVSNPPYVGTGNPLPPEVLAFEPAEALFAGDDGLSFLRRLSWEAREALSAGGFLAVEVGDGQAELARGVFEGEGWRFERAARDLSGCERALLFRSGPPRTSMP